MSRGTIPGHVIISTAADLLSEDGDNVEYDRAIVEMVTRLLNRSHDDHDLIAQVLRAFKQMKQVTS